MISYYPDTYKRDNTTPCNLSGLSMAFDARGSMYLAGSNNFYYKAEPHGQTLWVSTGQGDQNQTTGVAISPVDGLVYGSRRNSHFVEVMDPATGKLLKILTFEGQLTRGQCHPMLFIPLKVNSNLEWVLMVHDQYLGCGMCYMIDHQNSRARFVKEFYHGFEGYCTYIFDAKRSRLLIAKNNSCVWREWTWIP